MSSNQISQHISTPSINQIPSTHNITLGGQQTNKQNKQIIISNSSLTFSQNYAIQFQLKNISRQVNKFTEKSHLITNSSQPTYNLTNSLPLYDNLNNINHQQINLSSMTNYKLNSSQLGKYNYYRKQYRFQSQNPTDHTDCEQKLQYDNHELIHQDLQQQHKSFSPTTKYNPKRQQFNNKRQQLKNIPNSQSYYIYFDQQSKKSKEFNNHNISNNHSKLTKLQSKNNTMNLTNSYSIPLKKYSSALNNQSQFIRSTNQKRFQQYQDDQQARTPPLQHNFSKQQPQSKWVLQKKVKKLQKQLGQLKKKQQQRQKLTQFTYNNPKKDSKIFVGKQVDQLLNSLWP